MLRRKKHRWRRRLIMAARFERRHAASGACDFGRLARLDGTLKIGG
jgi:hypothetical protein